MKKFFLLSAIMAAGIMLSAQSQQGYVKTKGRMVDGEYVPGQGLKGATVSIKGKTTIMIAHRVSTVQNADHILVLDDGNTIEYGTYDELIARDGEFARMVRKQQLEKQLAREQEV